MGRMMACDGCIHARRVISENGLHYICTRPRSKAIACILGRKKYRREVGELKKGKQKPNAEIVRDDCANLPIW